MAFADPIYLSTTYQGGTFSLNVVNTGGNTYQVTYTADFTNWTGGNLYFTGLNWNFAGTVSSNPTLGSTTAQGNWNNMSTGPLTGGNLSKNGCNTGTGANFFCDTVSDADFKLNPTTGKYEWVFTLTYASTLTLADFTDNHIGGLFVNSDGQSQGILSQTGTVPEPASLSLLGLAFGGLALRKFRKRL